MFVKGKAVVGKEKWITRGVNKLYFALDRFFD
jgi:hypothetical protein